jgi:membrane protein DedA with SNARE-associated domain
VETALLAFYQANEALGPFLFLMVEEAGVPLWFIPGDALVMAAGARSSPRQPRSRRCCGRCCISSPVAYWPASGRIWSHWWRGEADDIAEVAVVIILLAIVIGALVRRRRGRQQPV